MMRSLQALLLFCCIFFVGATPGVLASSRHARFVEALTRHPPQLSAALQLLDEHTRALEGKGGYDYGLPLFHETVVYSFEGGVLHAVKREDAKESRGACIVSSFVLSHVSPFSAAQQLLAVLIPPVHHKSGTPGTRLCSPKGELAWDLLAAAVEAGDAQLSGRLLKQGAPLSAPAGSTPHLLLHAAISNSHMLLDTTQKARPVLLLLPCPVAAPLFFCCCPVLLLLPC
jgi:hypothetical protein